MENKRYFSAIKAELFQALTSAGKMDQLVNDTARIIGNPIGIGIIDDTVRYLSQGMPKDTVLTSPALFHKFYSQNIFKTAHVGAQKETNHIPKGVDLYEHVGAALLLDGITIGYFSVVLCDRPFQTTDPELVSIVRDVLQLALKTDLGGAFLLKIDNTNKLLQGLFEGEKTYLSRYALWDELELKKGNPVQVFVATYAQESGANTPMLQVREQLRTVLRCDLHIMKNKRFIFLCSYNLKEKQDAIQEVLHSFHLIAGVSYSFYKLEESQERYHQALDAMRHCEAGKGTGLSFYEDYVFFKITNELWHQKKLRHYCHPTALALQHYDQKKGTSLVETLQSYFSTGRNLEATAKNLNIHRNTVLRRLEKISELTKTSCFCADSLYNIYLSTVLINHYTI
ncbi:PucR family transcriptional regulator [Sinanaerobacter chloroacetimidivorans]|uniref:Helix-turn-helix domain-containing protein n=1 Tax=Sinanaerobacter chloroacetimidivorans TaxID=2818044 RepID=A0A8J8B2H2_9FIRM|nr:helix-turn-helix domain-containing protein [Sinanaerobacter chloroacetimidivorans]MBR0599813.1 helix-turn-helix domain-containing protein [Sinanaerobacter chloroacetimidivorans]